MDKLVVLFTMKSCPHCGEIKEMLKEENIPFVDRDIDDYEEEYELFVEATGNEFVPAFMLIEDPEESPKTRLLAPGRDFDELEEGVNIIREFYEI
jgi:glutaredoxin